MSTNTKVTYDNTSKDLTLLSPQIPEGAQSGRNNMVGHKMQPTRIELKITVREGNGPPHTAHIRNKGGYMYLSWRNGKRIKTLYLGKRRQPSPTQHSPARARSMPTWQKRRRAKGIKNTTGKKTAAQARRKGATAKVSIGPARSSASETQPSSASASRTHRNNPASRQAR